MPQTVIIDAIFIILTRPLQRTSNIAEYGKQLFNWHVLEQFQMGVTEVHLVFDGPTSLVFNPKQLELLRRQQSKTSNKHEHYHFEVNS